MVVVYGLKFWNKRTFTVIVKAKFQDDPFFTMDFKKADKRAKFKQSPVIAWSSRITEQQRKTLLSRPDSFLVEDGFIRSVGLGAGLAPGLSFVLDSQGIYYDGSGKSDLETMLNTMDLSNDDILNGRRLIDQLVKHRISKYNLQGLNKQAHPCDDTQSRILVVGQVTDDASIKSSLSKTIDCMNSDNVNLDLLKHVRNAFPDSLIAFKPHPDVSAGLREGSITHAQVLEYADFHFTDLDIIDAIDWCDHVQTISSLSGFEALLRGKVVTTHGTPFYAGWGLTQDHSEFPRRHRKRSIEELTHILLERYSYCVHPRNRKVCSAAELIEYLVQERSKPMTGIKNWLLLKISYVGTKLGF